MEIAVISSGRQPIPVESGGSVDNYAYNLAKGLGILNKEVHLFVNHKSKEFYREFEVVKIPYLKFPFKIDEVIFNLFSVTTSFFRRFDIIHTNTSTSTLLFSLFHKNIVFTSHSAFWWRSPKTHWRQILAVKRAKAVIVINRFIEKEVRKHKKENVFYIPNGVDTTLFNPTPFSKRKLKKTILSVGSISEQKGLIYLVDALGEIVKKDKEVKWVHVGPGASLENRYFKNLLKRIRKKGLSSNVIFTGRIHLKKLIWYYQNSTLFILPSLWEGMPLVILEAMSCGLPILANNIPGVIEFLPSEEIINVINTKKFSAKILELMNDEKMLRKLSKINRKLVVKNFSWKVIAKKMIKVYEAILQ